MSWLAKKLEEAQAQLNFRDGGRTAQTVRSDRQVEAARTQKLENNFKSPEWQQLQQKASQRNVQQLNTGAIDRPAYERQQSNILGNGQPLEKFKLTGFNKANYDLANRVSDNKVLRPALVGLASLSPTNVTGNLVGYAGRGLNALGVENGKYLAEAGDNVAGYSQGKDEFASRGLSDSLISGGIGLAGDLASFGAGGLAKGGMYGLKNAGRLGTVVGKVAPAVTTGRFFTQSANDLARNMEATGNYTPQQSFAAGTGSGLVSAALERTGMGKILGGTGNRAVSRIATAGLTEGLTEGSQELANNAAARLTYDKQRNLLQGVPQATIAGGILGAGARGGVELANPNIRSNIQEPIKAKTNPARAEAIQKIKEVQRAYDVEQNPKAKKEISRYLTELNKDLGRMGEYVPTARADDGFRPKAPESIPDPMEALKAEASYRSAHQIDSKTSRNIGDLKNVDDLVGQVKSKYGLTNYDQKDIANLKKIVGNPEADVKIYRASPVNEVNSGDWVTTSKSYAQDIKRQNGGKVYEHTVKAKDLNLPANIEDNPSLARFSAFQYNKVDTQATAPKAKVEPEIPSYIPKDRVDEYLKSDDYIKDQEFARMASETKSGDPFDHPDMYENPTPEIKKNLKAKVEATAPVQKPKTTPFKQDLQRAGLAPIETGASQTKPQPALKQPKVQKEPLQSSQTPQKTELPKGKTEKVQTLPKDKQIEISSDGRIANIDQYINQQVDAQEVKTGKSLKERAKTLKRQWVDTLAPAEDNFRELVKDGKISQETLDDIIVKNGKSLRSGTMANLNLVESGLVDLIHKKSKADYDNLGQTLIAIHSKDLRANGIETGRSPQVDEQIISKYGDQFKSDIEQFRKSADYVLNQSVDAQLISKETADLLKKKYPNYVPMNRVIEEIEARGSFNSGQVASIGKQTVVRKIRGSKRVVENPMESMISKVQDMSKQKLRNEAALSWVDALKDVGEAKLVKKVKPGESTISVLRNGTKEIYSVDPTMEAAAKGLTKEQMNVMVEVARKVSRVFKTGTTGMNLPFIVTNLARDQQTAFLNMQKGEVEVFKAIPSTIFETMGHGKLYQEAVRQGAISTSFDLTKPNLKQTAKGIRKKGASLGTFSKIEDVIGRSEEFTRLQQYKATKEY